MCAASAGSGGTVQLPAQLSTMRAQDDDGTAYIWDMKLRKFVEKGSQVPDYDESMMTFEATEETIPAMPQPSVVRPSIFELSSCGTACPARVRGLCALRLVL